MKPPPTTRKKKNLRRCVFCGIKLKVHEIVSFKCKCNNRYCYKHRLPSEHKCEFDHKNHDKNVLKKNIGEKCTSIKVTKI